jgi:2-(3-amino-3-carboxypropyl)histidine synthase
MIMLEFNLNRGISEAKKRKAKLVALQVPEGLKTRLPALIEEIERKACVEAFAFIEPCFGACGVKDVASKELGADLLIHFGHSKFVAREAIETVYIPVEYKMNERSFSLLVEKLAEKMKEKGFGKLGLCSTIQFRKHLKLVELELKKKGFRVFVGKGSNVEKGQVLGCNYSSVKAVEKKVEAVAFVGDGLFHPIGLSFSVKKPVFVINPVEGEIQTLSTQRDLFLRKRIAMIEKARQAKKVAIWASTKKGQQRLSLARQLKKKFEAKERKAFVFTSNLLSPDYIMGIGVEAIVCTACPRIALDDSSLYGKPVVNPEEALIALGEKKIEDYGFEELC